VNDRGKWWILLPDRLLDTNAVSAVMRQDARATAWLNSIDEDDHLFASVVTNAEVRYGIRRTPAGRRKEALEQAYDFFLDQMEDLLHSRGLRKMC